MKDIFLDSALKEKYMTDFNKVMSYDKEFWKIDNEFLKVCLTTINSNPHIQTLYSAYGDQNPNDSSSYLTFTFSKGVENQLVRKIIPDLIYIYNRKNNDDCFCWYQYFEPKTNVNVRERDKEFGLACLDDINYFMVNHIKLHIETYDRNTKEEFWNEITQTLANISNGM